MKCKADLCQKLRKFNGCFFFVIVLVDSGLITHLAMPRQRISSLRNLIIPDFKFYITHSSLLMKYVDFKECFSFCQNLTDTLI